MTGHRKRRQFKQTDAFTRGMVIGLKRAGWSIRQIAADTHLGASTVHRLWRRWLEQGNVAIYRNVGATRVTSARVDWRILRQAVAAPQATCTAILQHVQDTLDHSISTRTISRRLVANGLHSCRPLRRLPLTPPNRRQRLEWCRARSTWMTEWHRVVFSDESRVCLSIDSRRVRVWRRRGERSNPAAIVERPTVRQRGIMVWGAIAYDSRSPLLRIQGIMTAQRYVDDVLRPVTLPYLQGVANAIYQQDNARPHTARISQQALQDVQMLPWPPYSPDLSPIEHVWDIIGRRLHALPQPRSEDELWQMVEREWRAIPQDAIRTLIDSLPRRVAACIAVNPRMEEGEIVAHIIKEISEDTYQVLVAKGIQMVDEILKFCRHLATVKSADCEEEVSRALQPMRLQINVVHKKQPRTPYNIDRPTHPRNTEHWKTYDDKPICFHCGRPRHVVRYCRERRQAFAEARSRNGGEGRNGVFSSRPPRYDADDDYPRKVASPKTILVASPPFQQFSQASECKTLSGAASNGGTSSRPPRSSLIVAEMNYSRGNICPAISKGEKQRLFASNDFAIPPKLIKKINVINKEICGVRDVLVSTSKDLLLRKEVLIPNSLVHFDTAEVAFGLIESRDKLQEMQLKSREWAQEINLSLDLGLSQIQRYREKTATPDGLYQFRVMPFGLCNTQATFERMIDSVLGSLKWNMCFCYLDDIVVYTPTFEEDLRRLQLVFNVHPILGDLVDANGIHPDPDKVEAISEFPRPTNISKLRSFLGLSQKKAFEVLKTALISEPVLGHFDETADTHLHTDASGHSIGAVLRQIQGGKVRPIAYASRSLTKAENNYSTTEKECLAVVWSISKFRSYLEFEEKKNENFCSFIERLEQFLILEEASEEKKKAYLLTLIGGKAYETLKNLCSPKLPKEYKYEELIEKLVEYFSPRRSIIVERFMFFGRIQKETESVSEYLVEIKRLASTCGFGEFLKESLRDKLVCGMRNAKIQRRILSEGDVPLARVVEIALSMEAAEKNTRIFYVNEPADSVDKIRAEVGNRYNREQKRKCIHCGRLHKDLCRFREATCFRCGKRGHLATICRSRGEHTSERQVSRFLNQRKINQIEDQEEEESVQRMVFMRTYDYRVKYATNDPPYVIKMRVEDTLMTFEIDTGSCLTLISEKDFKRYLPDVQVKEAGIIVKTYDGTVVPILGEIYVKVDFRGTIAKLRAVVVRGERKALLEREWINVLKIGNYFVNQMPLEDTLAELLSEHQVVFGETTDPIKGFTFAVNIQDVNPIFHKARPVPFAIRTAVNEVLERMVEKDYLYQVPSSKWATPVVAVPKNNKEFRICCDFKVTLNRFLDTAAYPLPTQQDLFSVLARGKYFSKLDLGNAYLQLEVNPSTQPLLTINTHKGLFRFKKMPFGLANAPSCFQSVMDIILAGINGVICYIDDVLVSTASVEEHMAVLKTIFVRLQKHNIKLKREKCEFLRREIQYLGHLIKEDGIRPLEDKIQGLQKAKIPTNVSELRSFLGLVNYYGKFIPNLPELLEPLHKLLKKNSYWKWTGECEEAISECKRRITSEKVLVPYDATLPLSLATDASQIGVGAVLSHVIEGQEKPIMFASRTLSGAERNYSQIEREALAIIYGVTKFHQFIYGRQFTLITDHKPLVSILGPRAGIPTFSTSRLQRWGLTLAAYTYEIKFRITQDHGNADLLSRLPVESDETPVLNQTFILSYVEDLPVTAAEIGVETKKDEVLSVVKRYTQQGWPERVGEYLRPYFQRKLELTMDGECLLWGMRVIIPSSLRKNMLSCLHETHSGMGKMKAVARSHFWWPNLDNQIECMVNGCKNCQQTQTGPSKVNWRPWVWATRPWQRIHMDFAFKDGVNLLIVVDSPSKWVEAISMREITARKTIEQLRRLFSAYGLPEEVVSDNGPQFTGVEMNSFFERNGVRQTLIPAYHPQSNGLAERAVQLIKMALEKNKRKFEDTIQDTLSRVLLTYRCTPHETTGKTPSELFMGRSLRTRLTLIHQSLDNRVRERQARQMRYDRGRGQEEFEVDDKVWCNNFRGVGWIPGRIVGRKGSRVYTVLINGQVKTYHRDQIRRRWTSGEEGDEAREKREEEDDPIWMAPESMNSRRDRESFSSETAGLPQDPVSGDQGVEIGSSPRESACSSDKEARTEERPLPRRNPPRDRRPPVRYQGLSPLENDQPSAVMSLTNFDIEQTKDPDLVKIIDNLNSGYTRKESSIIDRHLIQKKKTITTGRPWLMMIPKHLR
ncbi:K02A2.6-like [Cordylochernes scorpioides]|uniref:RNA-directed DNA polymerase n=1 Tax=Cordylochernes scorpioides TaxID=51811 RepID=A0ABY6L5Y4_9ARAC|nr:K02A2.6-like [Cordylochernes scorpioides]